MDLASNRVCPNVRCPSSREPSNASIIEVGSFETRSARRKRYLCKICGKTFSANTGTAYFGLRCTRDEFDQVAHMRVEGVSVSAIARITRRSRNTIVRWLERAAASARRFNDQHLREFEIKELQADELCTFVGSKAKATWLFTMIEVASRLWPSRIVGRRSYRNTEAIFNDVIFRGRLIGTVLVATDGFDYYERVVRRLLGVACVYGQVTKTRRNNRVIRVERDLRIGTKSRLAAALLQSEDSETLNTSFVERHNLTLRQGLAYLQRRSPAHARCGRRLCEDLALVQCHYNFVRRHRGLKFGSVCKTPAMQAGLTQQPLSFRDIFAVPGVSRALATVVRIPCRVVMPESSRGEVQLAA